MRSKGWTISGRRLAAALMVSASVFALGAAPAAAQDARALAERMERLEREVQVMQRQLYRGDAPAGAQAPSSPAFQGGDLSGDVAARLQQRLIQLEELVTKLTGRVEENQYQVQQLSSKVDRFVDDVDFRLQEMEKQGGGGGSAGATAGAPAQGGAQAQQQAATPPANSAQGGGLAPRDGVLGGPSASQPPAAATAPSGAALPEGSPEDRYKYAFGLLRKNDYPAAARAFEAFLQQHPQHELAGNAQYWLGETYYVQGSMDKAAVAFLEGYRTYPKNNKAPDNLLKLGLTMANLQKNREACAAFGRIASEYPQAPDAIKRRAQSESQRLNCGG